MGMTTAAAQGASALGTGRDIKQNIANDAANGASTASAINSQNNTSVLNSARVGNETAHKFTKGGVEACKGMVS
jgi:hypothetical protein